MELWVCGVILALVGFLVIGCGFGRAELGLPFTAAGVTFTGAGSLIFVSSFKKWLKSL